jgi:glycosyltransferase involved in cell wall biosynthesis
MFKNNSMKLTAVKTKVVIIGRVFSAYRKPIYDILSKKYNFKFLHSQNKSGINQVITPYSVKIKSFDFSTKETGTYLFITNYLEKIKPQVVIHEFAIGILSMFKTYLKCKLLNMKFILYSHGYNRKTGFNPQKSWFDKIRLFYLKKADAIIVYGQFDKGVLSNYINTDKIFVAQNTLDTHGLSSIKNKLIEEGRENVKKRIGFDKQYNLVFIGRLLSDKNPDLVIDALDQLLNTYQVDVALHYVGGGGEYAHLKEKVESLGLANKVVFHGAMHNETKTGEILFASDMMVMPGYLGLSVNHAFCFDCPVMSFEQQENGPFHSPEVEYVVNNETGFLLQEHSVNSLAHALNDYLINPTLQLTIKKNIQKMVSEVFPIEKMVKGFDDAISYVLSK